MIRNKRGTCNLSDIVPAPYNPRTISDAQMSGLRASIDRWGLVQEIVVNRKTGHIVGGHQRVNALKENGQKKVPVVWVDISKDEEKALNIALNSPHITGQFDYEKLPDMLDTIKEKMPEPFENLRFDLLKETDAVILDDGDTPPSRSDEVKTAPAICGRCISTMRGMDDDAFTAAVAGIRGEG